MKKFLSLLLCLMLALSCFSFASASELIGLSLNHQQLHEYRSALEAEPVRYTSGRYTYILLSDGTAEIVEYITSTFQIKTLEIPAELDGHTVTSIGDGVFRGIQIGTLALPDTLTFIGDHAFEQTRLTEITLSDSLTFVGGGAFAGCSFSSVTLPDSLVSLGANPFRGCYNLTEIIVSDSHPTLEVIDGVLFDKQTRTLLCYPVTREGEELDNWYTAYQIPQGTLGIGAHAFDDCELNVITIPDSVTVITANPFVSCSELEEIRISETHPTLEVVDGVLFDKQTNTLICYPSFLEADSYTLPEGTAVIGASAFEENNELSSVILPDSVTAIGENAFAGCYQLRKIKFSDKLESIGDYAFDYCMNLDSVILPDSLTELGEGAFRDCTSLESVKLSAALTEIKAYSFDDCANLTALTLPDSVASIGDYAFRSCYEIDSLVLPASLVRIGAHAFRSCGELTSVTLSDAIVSIGESAFEGCGDLDSVEIPASVTSIGKYAFIGIENLTVPADSYAETYAKENDIPYTVK